MIDIAIAAAKEAGTILMHYYGHVSVHFKGDHFASSNMVTEADIASEKKILGMLQEAFPEHNVYGEEQGMTDKQSEYTWYVDPLDGTGNFSRNIPLFGVSIGLIKNKEAMLGVLYFPALDLLVHAERGKGAFANGDPIHVSKRDIKTALYYAAGLCGGKPLIEPNVMAKCGLIKIIDASSFEFAHIAKGDAELYILHTVPHDVVAGICIVREAGGRVTDYDGSDWTLDSEGVVASNDVIHDDVLAVLDSASLKR
jgi:myo-inositol-1(or 4)-monophosphatase